MPLVSCITINHSGKRQVIFVWWLVNFPDSFAGLDKLRKLWQHCEQHTLEGWILLDSLPILGSGAAGLCLASACRMIFWPDLKSKSWDLELQGVQRQRTVCSSSWLETLQTNLGRQGLAPSICGTFPGLYCSGFWVQAASAAQLGSDQRQSLGLAKSLPKLQNSKGGLAQSTCREHSKSS